MKIKRYTMILLALILVLTGLPVAANAAGNPTVVGFELINADEIPALVENPYSTSFISNQYCLHNAIGAAVFRVTYSDGTSELAYASQKIGEETISWDYLLDGPGGSQDTVTFYLGDFEVVYQLTFAETNVASLEILSEPVLVLGKDPAVSTIGPDRALMLNETYGCVYPGLSFRINYTDGTSEVVYHENLDWPDHSVYDKFCSFPKHNGYNVEVQAHITGYSQDTFSYWTGTYFPEDGGVNGFPMTLHYKGCVVNFTLTVEEGSKAAVVYQPYDIEAIINSEVAFEVGATGPNLTYEWQYRTSESASWKICAENENQWYLWVTASSEKDGRQYRCKVTDSNGNVVYSDPATLTIKYPAKIVNFDTEGYFYYYLEELVLGSDGVYRTPDGFAAYLAINNVGDGGLWWLKGYTLYDYVDAFGADYFDLTYWDNLLALMDGDGYVLLTEQTLKYFLDLTTGNPAWEESDGTYVYYYLAFDYDRTPVTHPDGWAQENGTWYYYQDNQKVTGWLKDGNYWYYMGADGAMTVGWVQVNGNWYYMNKSGVMVTGWQKINGYWYYMSSGGVMQTGWVSVGGKWYYMNANGVMQTGWVGVGGKWYYMASGGAMQTGWITVNGYRYYLDSKGVMQTGWNQIDGNWYYMSSGGVMQTGWVSDGGYWYYMGTNGVMQKGWVSAGGKWYYMNKSGVMVTGWLKDGNYWYYLGSDGAMVTGTQVINGKTYVFNKSGVWIG